MSQWRLQALLLLTFGHLSYAVSKDCLVTDRLDFDAGSSDSVAFSALPLPNGSLFTALVTCRESQTNHDTLTFATDSIALKQRRKMSDKEKFFSSPGEPVGWTDFSLVNKPDGYKFKDADGRSWISEEQTQGCRAGKVSVEKGLLMNACHDGSPTWQVSDGQCVEVPIPQPDSEWNLQLTLASEKKSFTPSFRVEGSEFALTWMDDALVAVTGNAVPLPPKRSFHLMLQLSIEERILLKALVDGRTDLTLTQISKPRAIEVCDKGFSAFTLQLHLVQNNIGNGNESLYWAGISVGAAFGTGIIILVLFYLGYQLGNVSLCIKKPVVTSENDAGKEASPADLYLEPNPPPPRREEPKLGDLTRCSDLTGSTSSSEHIYEEMEEAESWESISQTYCNMHGKVSEEE